QDVANNTVTSYDANGNKAQITSSGTLSSGGGLTPAFTLGVLAPHSVTFSNTGDFTITAVGSGSNGGTGTSNTFSVIKATPAFSNLSSPSISYSTSPTVLSGNLSLSGTVVPTGAVAITLNSVTQNATIQSNGSFSSSFNTATLGVTNSPYTI